MPDAVTAMSFDNAVMTFGVWCENKLHELDDNKRPKYTLEQLLSDEFSSRKPGVNKAGLKLLNMLRRVG